MNTESNKTSYPLCWPDGWPRVTFRRDSPFKRSCSYAARHHSMDEVRRALSSELNLLGASKVILSTNVELRLDGLPYSGRRAPLDCGAAVYFTFKGKQVALACDKWNRVEDNVWAICKHIEALRGQQRWGVGSIEQAFRGYMAIPERTSGSAWWNVLGVTINATTEQIQEAYRAKAKLCHPDLGGTDAEMAQVNLAYEEAQAAANGVL